jgi:hypothetical protein
MWLCMFGDVVTTSPSQFGICVQFLESPLAAVAAVAAVQTQLTATDFFVDAISLSALPHLLLLLQRTVRQAPNARSRVVQAVAAALPPAASERPDAARALLRVWVDLLLAGHALDVLDAAEQWSIDADPALLRFFTLQVQTLCVTKCCMHCACCICSCMYGQPAMVPGPNYLFMLTRPHQTHALGNCTSVHL